MSTIRLVRCGICGETMELVDQFENQKNYECMSNDCEVQIDITEEEG